MMQSKGGPMAEMSERERFEVLEIGKPTHVATVVVTQQMIDYNRKGLDWPDAPFPVLHKGDNDKTQDRDMFPNSRVNARSIRRYYNPPIPGKKIHLTHTITDKYLRGDIPYLVVAIDAVD